MSRVDRKKGLGITDKVRKDQWSILIVLPPIILANIPGCIVEIGMGKYSTRIWAEHSRAYGRKFYGVDTSRRIVDAIREAPYVHDGMEFFQESSIKFMNHFEDVPAVVFLDGNHHENIVRKEVHYFLDKIPCGGVIFMHDTLPMEGYYEKKLKMKGREMTTYKVRHELEKMDNIEVFTWPYTAQTCGLTMVLKKDMNQKFYRL